MDINEGFVNPWRKYNFVRTNPSCLFVYFLSAGFPHHKKQPIVNPTSSGTRLDYIH